MSRSRFGRQFVHSVARLLLAAMFLPSILGWALPLPVVADGRDQLRQGGSDLPDRPDPVALPVRPPRPRQEPERLKGGHIELHIKPAVDIWTEVEWQDSAGNWHIVDNWRGYAATNGVVRWFVKESDLGTGPFRWRIYLYEGGDELGTSDLFFLPHIDGTKVIVRAQVREPAVFFP